MTDDPTVIQTPHVQQMIKQALAVAKYLDGKPITDEVEWEGRLTTPAMLMSMAMNRLDHARAELDATRLTYFGFPEDV